MNPSPNCAIEPISASSSPLQAAVHAPVLVRELSSHDRARLLTHFLALDSEDRLLRFGQIIPGRVIENYVHTLDFSRDTVFGVFNHELELVGAGHLAYFPAESGKRIAEFGVSVLESSRGKGIGTRLFERAIIRSRNTRVDQLYIHCLARNTTMMRIARKAGMTIEYTYGEADAYLALPPADQTTIVAELLQEQTAVFDYAIKRQMHRTTQFIELMVPCAVEPSDIAA
jgi:GNAT superfamily N-acetyltransferase